MLSNGILRAPGEKVSNWFTSLKYRNINKVNDTCSKLRLFFFIFSNGTSEK